MKQLNFFDAAFFFLLLFWAKHWPLPGIGVPSIWLCLIPYALEAITAVLRALNKLYGWKDRLELYLLQMKVNRAFRKGKEDFYKGQTK